MIHAKSHPRVQNSKLWLRRAFARSSWYTADSSLDGSSLRTLRPIRIELPPLDSISSCGQWVIVVTLVYRKAHGPFLKLYLPHQHSSCAIYGFKSLRQRPASLSTRAAPNHFLRTEEADLLSGERRRRQIPSLTAAIAPRGNRPTLPRW